MAAVAVLLAAFALQSSAAAPQRPKDKAAPVLRMFEGALKPASLRATERNVPIVAIVVLDDEPDNVAARDELLASPEIALLSAGSVLFFSNNGEHKTKEIVETIDGVKRTRTVCSAFLTANCREHRQHWDEIYAKYSEEGELRCPQVLVITPDLKLEERISPGHKPEISTVVSTAATLQAKLGRGLDDAALVLIADAGARAARAELDGRMGSMWRALAEILVISPDGARALKAQEGQKRALEALAKLRDGAQAKLAIGDGLEGYLELAALALDWAGTDQAAEITRAMKRAEKEPALKEALAKKKREDEAEALWKEAEAALAAKQAKEHERKIRLLLRKYSGTTAWERAAKAYPDWRP